MKKRPALNKKPLSKNKDISVIMGSDSDWPAMESAVSVLEDFGVTYEVRVVSAHRTPRAMQSYALSCKARGIRVIIAGAGGSAHLPGMVASLTSLPVIGVPVMTKKLDGLDSLLSIVQMPRGIPVATMAVEGSTNAALLAIRILALSRPVLSRKLVRYMKQQADRSRKKKIKSRG